MCKTSVEISLKMLLSVGQHQLKHSWLNDEKESRKFSCKTMLAAIQTSLLIKLCPVLYLVLSLRHSNLIDFSRMGAQHKDDVIFGRLQRVRLSALLKVHLTDFQCLFALRVKHFHELFLVFPGVV